MTATTVTPFVDVTWLIDHLGDVVPVEVRWCGLDEDPVAAYLAGHIPGAVRLDLDDDLAAPPTTAGGRHPLPTPEAFASACARVGLGDDTVVVAYDHGPGAFAARLAWMLRVTGHEAAVLSGGIAAWSGALETGPSSRPASAFTPKPWPADEIADADQAAALAAGADTVLVDARSADRFRGETEPIDARPGHIPGAINLPFADNLDETGRLREAAWLAERFDDVAGATDAAVSCGSGVTACHDILAMEQAGFARPRLFVGSWSAWSADPTRPAATGS